MRHLLLSALLAFAADKPFRFDKADVGKLPAGWKAAQTYEGKGSVWAVVADPTAPSGTGHALAQTAKGPSRLFNLCVVEKSSARNLDLSVKFKAVSGKIDQGGGVVWRYQDPDNYYVCRYNPLEGNFRVYKVVKGKRVQLATKEPLAFGKDKWYTLSISHTGDAITCSLEGEKYLEVKDDTFAGAGKVGLWTKADAETYFDDLVLKAK
jgi:hypothetical protein